MWRAPRQATTPSRVSARALAAALLGLTVLQVASVAEAQRFSRDRPSERRPELPPFEPEIEERGEILPPLELPKGLEAPAEEGAGLFVKGYRFEGNEAISSERLQEIAKPYTGRPVSYGELQVLRDEITLTYVEAGYVSSGATLPDQDVEDGIVRIVIVEDVLEEVDISTDGRLRQIYLRPRLEGPDGETVNLKILELRLQRLQENPNVARIDAELVPGSQRGRSVLRVDIREPIEFYGALAADDYIPPTIGSYEGGITGGHTNVLGLSDELNGGFWYGEGLYEFTSTYVIPVTPWDTFLSFYGTGTWNEVTEQPFKALDVESRSYTVAIGLAQPVYRGTAATLSLFAGGEYRRSKSKLLGEGFSFTPGPEDGVAKIWVTRFGADWAYRSRSQVLALRGTLSVGLDIFNATHNSGNVPDSQFVSGLVQAEYAARLPWWSMSLLMRADVQVSDSPLLGLEQYALGGRYTVRGYRENLLVRDNGTSASAELRLPVWGVGSESWLNVDLAAFADFGYSWNDQSTDGPQTLSSVGLGVLGDFLRYGFFEFYWGHAIRDVDIPGKSYLQDDGVHFQIGVRYP